MKVGIVANIMQDKPLAKALDYFRNIGIQTIEPGCGGYAGKSHVKSGLHLLFHRTERGMNIARPRQSTIFLAAGPGAAHKV